MITAVDTNVLLDVFTADPRFGPSSRDALRRCLAEGSLIACDVVWAEVTAAFDDPAAASSALDGLEVGYDGVDRDAAQAAGLAWRRYRATGGARRRIVPDLIIGAHAAARAERLLTRDRGFYRASFAELTIFDPTYRSPSRG
jgi:predicted nucleic acid-binding protein